MELNGKPFPLLCIDKAEGNFFGIGDWGGDQPNGHAWKNGNKCDGNGEEDGLEVSLNSSSAGRPCTHIDYWAQQLVAGQMVKRSADSDPDYVLNAGDNFYPGGYNRQCGQGQDGQDSSHQFDWAWAQLYNKDKLKDKPWFSVLGNHDYGGISHRQGWDLQVFITWSNKNWVMPAQTWSRLVQYKDFAVQYFFLDSNFLDAHSDAGHTMCQGGTECYGFNDGSCAHMLQQAWDGGLDMMGNIMKTSTAEWHIVVTHFTGPSVLSQPKLVQLHDQYGIDLVFTGHQHSQMRGNFKGVEYIISGGGVGITTDTGAGDHEDGYGFIDFTISRTKLTATFVNWAGNIIETKEYTPHAPKFVSAELVV